MWEERRHVMTAKSASMSENGFDKLCDSDYEKGSART
jgi:hypothetical protein